MNDCDVHPPNSPVIRLGPTIDESDVDGMTINPMAPCEVENTLEVTFCLGLTGSLLLTYSR